MSIGVQASDFVQPGAGDCINADAAKPVSPTAAASERSIYRDADVVFVVETHTRKLLTTYSNEKEVKIFLQKLRKMSALWVAFGAPSMVGTMMMMVASGRKTRHPPNHFS